MASSTYSTVTGGEEAQNQPINNNDGGGATTASRPGGGQAPAARRYEYDLAKRTGRKSGVGSTTTYLVLQCVGRSFLPNQSVRMWAVGCSGPPGPSTHSACRE